MLSPSKKRKIRQALFHPHLPTSWSKQTIELLLKYIDQLEKQAIGMKPCVCCGKGTTGKSGDDTVCLDCYEGNRYAKYLSETERKESTWRVNRT